MISAHYFDGHSARLHHVELSAANGAIHLRGDTERTYSMAGTRLAEPFAHAPTVLYFNDGTHAEVPDAAMRPLLLDALGYRKSRVVRWQEHSAAALVALALLVTLIASAWFWGLPAAAERLSRAIPPSADHALGRHALAVLQKQGILNPSRLGDERLHVLEGMFQRMKPATPRIPLRLLVANAPRLGPNALAFPDGTIVVTDQLVGTAIGEKGELDARAAAALAGVLAHEIGHIEMRHSVRSITRSSLTAALSATLFGDFSAVAAGLPALLGNMEYSREMELAADEHAAAALRRHGISILPLADLFDQLDEKADKMPKFLRQVMSYASTHPDGYARSQRLREAAAGQEK
ncbi:M48 family metallopeptidase [Massilia consociata]|uniref:M48 family metallopeptidase n=1 Tax=Massilia consociata TaxID=760117 RepID=A0ABV6FHL2_9BURK